MGFREREHGIWREWTWTQTLDEILAIAAGLRSLGLKADEAMIVVGDNRARLYFSMLAAMSLRAWPAPSVSRHARRRNDALRLGSPRFALAEDQEQVDKLIELRARTGRPQTIIYDDPRGLVALRRAGARRA